jgi:hypothetical protein
MVAEVGIVMLAKLKLSGVPLSCTCPIAQLRAQKVLMINVIFFISI